MCLCYSKMCSYKLRLFSIEQTFAVQRCFAFYWAHFRKICFFWNSFWEVLFVCCSYVLFLPNCWTCLLKMYMNLFFSGLTELKMRALKLVEVLQVAATCSDYYLFFSKWPFSWTFFSVVICCRLKRPLDTVRHSAGSSSHHFLAQDTNYRQFQ